MNTAFEQSQLQSRVMCTENTFIYACIVVAVLFSYRVAFGTQFAAQVVLLLGRMFTGSKLNLKTISKYPFFRSVILLHFGISAICASIRFGVADDIYNTLITSFSLPATILSWWVFVYALLPTDSYTYPAKMMKEDYDEDDTEEMDEDYDEEDGEAIEAKYRRGANMGRVQVRK